MVPMPEALSDARKLLSRYLPLTPARIAPSLSSKSATVYLKLELELPTGSFKPRGALYALSVNMARRKIEEVTASSTGNHGAAVAFAAKALGLRATIFLPKNANVVKRKKIEDLGARIVEHGADLDAAFQEALKYSDPHYSNRPGVYFLNDATDRDVPTGTATIGAEILEQVPNVERIYVPMGDTALIRGVAAAAKQMKPDVRVIGVQAERAPSYYLSWKQGIPVPTETCDTIADGLATRTPQLENVMAIREIVDEVVLVSEEQMTEAIGALYRSEKVLAEPAGAATTAAFMAAAFTADSANEGISVLVVSGGNISEDMKARAGIP
jgi:threonine dehydratase